MGGKCCKPKTNNNINNNNKRETRELEHIEKSKVRSASVVQPQVVLTGPVRNTEAEKKEKEKASSSASPARSEMNAPVRKAAPRGPSKLVPESDRKKQKEGEDEEDGDFAEFGKMDDNSPSKDSNSYTTDSEFNIPVKRKIRKESNVHQIITNDTENKEKEEKEKKEKEEKERKEKEEKEKKEKEEKERKEKEKKEKEEKERLEKEKKEKERLEKERLEKERLEKERLEKERLEKEQQEKEHQERERLEKERLEKERLEKERLEKEKAENEQNLPGSISESPTKRVSFAIFPTEKSFNEENEPSISPKITSIVVVDDSFLIDDDVTQITVDLVDITNSNHFSPQRLFSHENNNNQSNVFVRNAEKTEEEIVRIIPSHIAHPDKIGQERSFWLVSEQQKLEQETIKLEMWSNWLIDECKRVKQVEKEISKLEKNVKKKAKKEKMLVSSEAKALSFEQNRLKEQQKKLDHLVQIHNQSALSTNSSSLSTSKSVTKKKPRHSSFSSSFDNNSTIFVENNSTSSQFSRSLLNITKKSNNNNNNNSVMGIKEQKSIIDITTSSQGPLNPNNKHFSSSVINYL